MTLHVYDDIEQRSDEWLNLRCGMVTASVVGQLLTTKTNKPASNDDSRRLTALLVAERITGQADPTFQNADMFRGVIEEPRARDHYAELNGVPVTEVGFMVRREQGWTLGLSPDGLVGDEGLLEIKAPRAKTHIDTVINNEVPAHYMPQLQAALLVSGRKWIDFVSWCGGEPMWPIRVHPDEEWHEAIVAAVALFEIAAADRVARYEAATAGLPKTERLELEIVQ